MKLCFPSSIWYVLPSHLTVIVGIVALKDRCHVFGVLIPVSDISGCSSLDHFKLYALLKLEKSAFNLGGF